MDDDDDGSGVSFLKCTHAFKRVPRLWSKSRDSPRERKLREGRKRRTRTEFQITSRREEKKKKETAGGGRWMLQHASPAAGLKEDDVKRRRGEPIRPSSSSFTLWVFETRKKREKKISRFKRTDVRSAQDGRVSLIEIPRDSAAIRLKEDVPEAHKHVPGKREERKWRGADPSVQLSAGEKQPKNDASTCIVREGVWKVPWSRIPIQKRIYARSFTQLLMKQETRFFFSFPLYSFSSWMYTAG